MKIQRSQRSNKLSDYTLINTGADLQKYLNDLLEAKHIIIALDTEANNHMHAYGQQLCLIQVYDGTSSIIIDPNNIEDATLRNFFESRGILKVMYDASNDISLLVNSKNITIKSILDLRPGVELLKYGKQDLHSVIFAELGIELKHKARFQVYNWLRRPLSEEALEYALNDVKYLLKLKDIIIKKIYSRQLLDLFILRNIRVQNRDYFVDPKDYYQRVKGYKNLDNECKPRFQQLHVVREKYAKLVNMPSANIIPNNLLLNIATNSQTLEDITFPQKLREDLKNRMLQELRQVIETSVLIDKREEY
jgi:ribonuclease D